MATKGDRYRSLRILKERSRLERVAHERGFESYEKLLYELYIVQGYSIEQLQARLFTPHHSLKLKLRELGLITRGKGGPNNRKFVLTDELIAEASRIGVWELSLRLGVDPVQVASRLKEWFNKQKGGKP